MNGICFRYSSDVAATIGAGVVAKPIRLLDVQDYVFT